MDSKNPKTIIPDLARKLSVSLGLLGGLVVENYFNFSLKSKLN